MNKELTATGARSLQSPESISFVLKPRPPFGLELAVWTLRRRPQNAIDHWDGSVYRRVLPTSGAGILLEVRQLPGRGPPRLSVCVSADQQVAGRDAIKQSELRAIATAAVERLLGIRIDLKSFHDFAACDTALRTLARRFQGMKPPRFLTGFECLVNAIACQQISLAAGLHLLNRFAETYGQPFQNDNVRQFAFPRPVDLVDAEVQDLRRLGFSRQKATAVLTLAAPIRNDEFDLNRWRSQSDEAAVAGLRRLQGVGRWTAEYALLRGLGKLNVFPGDDIGARNNLCRWLGISDQLDYEGTCRVVRRWHPFGGLLYFHLLLDKLSGTAAFCSATE